MTFEGFLDEIQGQGQRPRLWWNGSPVNAATMALAARRRLDLRVKGQAFRPLGFELVAPLKRIGAVLRTNGYDHDDSDQSVERLRAGFDDMKVELKRTADPWEREHDAIAWSVHATELQAQTSAAGHQDLHEHCVAAAFGRVETARALTMVGGGQGFANLEAFIAAMAKLIGQNFKSDEANGKWPPGARHAIMVEAETSLRLAGASATGTRDPGPGMPHETVTRGPLSVVRGATPACVEAIQFAIAKARPVMDETTPTYQPLHDDRGCIIARADVPAPTSSATMAAVDALERRKTMAEVTSYLQAIGAPAPLIEGLAS